METRFWNPFEAQLPFLSGPPRARKSEIRSCSDWSLDLGFRYPLSEMVPTNRDINVWLAVTLHGLVLYTENFFVVGMSMNQISKLFVSQNSTRLGTEHDQNHGQRTTTARIIIARTQNRSSQLNIECLATKRRTRIARLEAQETDNFRCSACDPRE